MNRFTGLSTKPNRFNGVTDKLKDTLSGISTNIKNTVQSIPVPSTSKSPVKSIFYPTPNGKAPVVESKTKSFISNEPNPYIQNPSPKQAPLKATFGDVAQVPSYVLGKFFVEPAYNMGSSIKELATGKPLPKLEIPALTKNFAPNFIDASSYQQRYADAIESGTPEKEAYKETLIAGILDAVQLASPVKSGIKYGLKKTVPETLIKPTVEKVSKQTLYDYLSGRKTAEQLGISPKIKEQITGNLKTMNTQQKIEFLQGFEHLEASPSFVGKMFGVTEAEAKQILAKTFGPTTRQASAGALPGYQINPQAGAINPKGTPVGFGPEPTPSATPSTQRLFPERKVPEAVVPSQSVPPVPSKPVVQTPIPSIVQGPAREALSLPKDISSNESIQRKILEARDAEQAQGEFQSSRLKPDEYPTQQEEIRNVSKELNIPEVASTYKDIGLVKTQFRDIYRNSEQVFGKDFPVIDRTILQPLEESKSNLINFYNEEIAKFKNSPASQFKRGSPESAAIQEFGEGLIKYDELVKKFGPVKAKQIEDAVPFFRDSYKNLIDRLNAVEMSIYPNNPARWTPTLKNYFRHGTNAQDGIAKLQSIYENPIKIDPNLVGLTEDTKPLSKWQSFKQRRLTGKDDKPDAVGGFLDYLANAGYSINIDPHIGKFRALADALSSNTKSKNLNNYIMQVTKFADRLAGKSNDLDRAVGGVVGRTNLEAVNWLNNRVKANTVLANVSSSLAQAGNIPQGIMSAGIPNSIKALGKTLAQNFVENPAMKQSTFIKERFFKGFDQFDTGMLNNTKKFAKWMITVLDEAGTKFIWNGQYEKGKQLGLEGKELIQYADKNAKKLVAGRGIGDLPLIQSSKVFQLAAPFQLEVTGLWWAMEDLWKAKKIDKSGFVKYIVNPKTGVNEPVDISFANKFGKFATLFISLYYLNNTIEKATGNRPLLDPVQTTLDGIEAIQSEPNATGVGKAAGRFAGEFLGNIPFGQTVANYYKEFGPNFMGHQLPTRKEIFGRNDPTRFGTGLLVNKGISDPLFKVLPPFGGAQIKKTIQGIKAVDKGKSTTVNDKFQYKINKTPGNKVKAALFGKSSLPESQAYYDKKAGITPSKTKGLKGTKSNRFKGL